MVIHTNDIETTHVDRIKIDKLLEKYAEKINGGQNAMAFGMRFAMKYLGIVTDEQIHHALDKAEKTKRRKEKQKMQEKQTTNTTSER